MPQVYDWEEISKHSRLEDLFLVIEGKVYDVTKFQHEHPGGDEYLVDQGGQDVSELFDDAGHSDEARRILNTLVIGKVKGEGEVAARNTPKSQMAKTQQSRSVSGLNTHAALVAFVTMAMAICAPFLLYPNLGSTLVTYASVSRDGH